MPNTISCVPGVFGRTPAPWMLFAQGLRALEQGGMTVFGPVPAFADRLLQNGVDLEVSSPRVFDLQVALCALDGGATELWTELWTYDRRFVKMPGPIVHDPLG